MMSSRSRGSDGQSFLPRCCAVPRCAGVDEVKSCLMTSNVLESGGQSRRSRDPDFPNGGCHRIDHTSKTNLTVLTPNLKLSSATSKVSSNVNKVNDNDRDGKGCERIQSNLGATHRRQ